MKCDICNLVIIGDPVIKEWSVAFGNSDGETEETIVKHFCSVKCKMIDDIMEHSIYYGDDIRAIVNHLIKDHGSKIEDLEDALNSNDFKDLWGKNIF